MTIIERFLAKVEIDEHGCWLWTAACASNGYGTFKLQGRQRIAHRVSFELFVGEIPEGLQLDHLCRVIRCVNPDHLEPVTARENIMRGEGFAGRYARRDTCLRGHPFDYWNGRQRVCLACFRHRYAEKKNSAS